MKNNESAINPDSENQEISLDALNTQLKEAIEEQKRLPGSTRAGIRVLMLQEQIEKFKKEKHE